MHEMTFPPTDPPKSASHPNPATQTSRPSLPQRSNSTLTAAPPADAIKADEDAIADMYRQVNQTGSLEAAAKKLQQYARAWEDDPEEREYLEQIRETKRNGVKANAGSGTVGAEGLAAAAGKMSLAQQRMMQAFADEDDGDEDAVMAEEIRDEQDYEVFEDDEDDVEEEEVVHLQQVEDGLWIGDLVAAMDTAGLEAKGIVSSLSSRFAFRVISKFAAC